MHLVFIYLVFFSLIWSLGLSCSWLYWGKCICHCRQFFQWCIYHKHKLRFGRFYHILCLCLYSHVPKCIFYPGLSECRLVYPPVLVLYCSEIYLTSIIVNLTSRWITLVVLIIEKNKMVFIKFLKSTHFNLVPENKFCKMVIVKMHLIFLMKENLRKLYGIIIR